MKKTLYIYLIKEQTIPLAVCFLGLCLVLVTGRLLQLTSYLFASSASALDIFSLIALAIPGLVLYALPMATLLGTLLGFVRLNSDNELVAFKTAGIGFHQFLPGVLSLLVAAALFSFLNSFYIMPHANRAFEIKLRAMGRSILPALLKEGRFIDTIPNLLFFFESVDTRTLQMKGIFVQDQREPKIRVAIVADRGQIFSPQDLNQLTLRVSDGVITRVSDDLSSAQAITFKNYDLTLHMDDIFGAVGSFKKGRKEMTIVELFELVWKSASPEENILALEFHRRLALPLSCLILGLIGVPLGALSRHSGRMAGVSIGLAIFLAYYLILSAGKALGENGLLNPFLSVWLANLLFLGIALYLWNRLQWDKSFDQSRILDILVLARQRLPKPASNSDKVT